MGVKCFRLTKKKSVVCLFCRFFSFRLLFVVFSLHVKADFFFAFRTRKTCEMYKRHPSPRFVSLSLFFCRGNPRERTRRVFWISFVFGYNSFSLFLNSNRRATNFDVFFFFFIRFDVIAPNY